MMACHTKDQAPLVITVAGTEEQRLKDQAALQLLRTWRTADAQEQAETWTGIKAALEEDRLSGCRNSSEEDASGNLMERVQ